MLGELTLTGRRSSRPYGGLHALINVVAAIAVGVNIPVDAAAPTSRRSSRPYGAPALVSGFCALVLVPFAVTIRVETPIDTAAIFGPLCDAPALASDVHGLILTLTAEVGVELVLVAGKTRNALALRSERRVAFALPGPALM